MTTKRAEETSELILANLRSLATHYGCRLDASSDTGGALARICCCASSADREFQGFGLTFAEAVENLNTQPVRRSSARARIPSAQ